MQKQMPLPQHVAIVMDGNGRWALQHSLPRIEGHRAGVESVRKIIDVCREKKIPFLTLFAFSSENWQRPAEEVSDLMELFVSALKHEITKLHSANIRVRFIGDRSKFTHKLIDWIEKTELLTRLNSGLTLVIAVNYGGYWDILESVKKIAQKVQEGSVNPEIISAQLLEQGLSTAEFPHPDLFIRTSGEQRISNFLIWQLAYTELYFTEKLWPDFNQDEFNKALKFYQARERRFGCTSEQINSSPLSKEAIAERV
jgi:undecaprenyl diphosphate synthase